MVDIAKGSLISAAVGVMALSALGWVWVLRRQVAERGRQLELEIQERQFAERYGEIEQERTRVAQDLHDELGATLTEISMLGTLARTPALPPADRDLYLDKLTDVSRAVVATLDEIVWAVNPKYDSVASLASYYSLFAQRFLNLAGIACRLEVAEIFPNAPLDSRLRHGIFLAFKEALNNAVRHSGASQILIAMEVVENQLKIAVVDNGRGFNQVDIMTGSDGLINIKGRMSKLGGHCEITSEPCKERPSNSGCRRKLHAMKHAMKVAIVEDNKTTRDGLDKSSTCPLTSAASAPVRRRKRP